MRKLKTFSVPLTKKQIAAIRKELKPFYGLGYCVLGQTRTNTPDPQDDMQFLVIDKSAGKAINRVLKKMQRIQQP